MATSTQRANADVQPGFRAEIARRLGTFVFYSLLGLIVVVSIPYGTVEPWWKALFQCIVFLLAGLYVIERLLWPYPTQHDRRLLLPAAALILFAFLQTVSWSEYSIAGVDKVARTVSADAFQTRLFLSQLVALVLAGSLLVLHTSNRRRLRLVVEVVIAIGVVSAGFGLLRQAMQNETGFILPYLQPGFGYAQFINANHFAFLMEMALGLALGIVVCRGVSRRRLVLYVVATFPMWVALVRSNSRAGVVSILCQVVFLAFLAGSNRSSHRKRPKNSRARFQTTRLLAFRTLLIVALLAGAVITMMLFGGEPLARKLDSLSVELNPKTAQVYVLRLNIWQSTVDLIKDHPIAGVGFGAYWIAITRNHHASGEITPQDAHSDYLELLASGGLIGFAIGVWLAFVFIRTARRKLRTADRYSRAVTFGALTGIMTVAVHSLVESGLHITINALILTALVAIVVMNVQAEPAEGDARVE